MPIMKKVLKHIVGSGHAATSSTETPGGRWRVQSLTHMRDCTVLLSVRNKVCVRFMPVHENKWYCHYRNEKSHLVKMRNKAVCVSTSRVSGKPPFSIQVV